MKIKLKILFLFCLLTPLLSEGQNYLSIQKKKNTSPPKKLFFDRLYTIKTKDTTYITEIINVVDSSLIITKQVRNYDSIRVVVKYPNRPKCDTVYDKPYWRKDTIKLAQHDIEYLETDLLRNRKWLDPFVWIIIGGGVGTLIGLESADGVSPGAGGGLGFACGIAFITAPVLYIGTRKLKFNMTTKWGFVKSK